VRHLHGGERLGQRSDLVDLDQDGIGNAIPDTCRQSCDVCDEQVVADDLTL
jgi:hypothetical protein